MIENNIPRELVIEFLKYHYADGSTNGSGKIRLTSLEYKVNHQDEIDKINKFLNQDDFLIKSIDRFVVKGRNSKESIDTIIYGTINDFLWIKTKDVYNILLKHKEDYSTGIHFSNLFYQPLDRCINRNPRYESRRYISQIKWYSLFDDILENMNDNSDFNI